MKLIRKRCDMKNNCRYSNLWSSIWRRGSSFIHCVKFRKEKMNGVNVNEKVYQSLSNFLTIPIAKKLSK